MSAALRNQRGIFGLYLVLLAAFWFWQRGTERRALLRMRQDQRAEIFAREFANLKTLCGNDLRTDDLADRCREIAKFVQEFPECDSRCLATAQGQVARPANPR